MVVARRDTAMTATDANSRRMDRKKMKRTVKKTASELISLRCGKSVIITPSMMLRRMRSQAISVHNQNNLFYNYYFVVINKIVKMGLYESIHVPKPHGLLSLLQHDG